MHGATSKGLQLKFAKAGAARSTISKAEAIEGALCYGCIDGRINKLDRVQDEKTRNPAPGELPIMSTCWPEAKQSTPGGREKAD